MNDALHHVMHALYVLYLFNYENKFKTSIVNLFCVFFFYFINITTYFIDISTYVILSLFLLYKCDSN